MKPDIWAPFFGQDFDRDTRGWSRADKWSYWGGALWAYWCGGCEGLPDDDAMLRRICECEQSDWARCKGLIFDGNGKFCLRNGKWHQKRAESLYQEAVRTMLSASVRGKLGAEARWHKHSQSNAQALLKQSLPDATSTSTSESPSDAKSESDVGAKGSRPTENPESFLEELSGMDAYRGIDVQREFGKMVAWCKVNHRKPNKRRFVNWLNRADVPINIPLRPVRAETI